MEGAVKAGPGFAGSPARWRVRPVCRAWARGGSDGHAFVASDRARLRPGRRARHARAVRLGPGSFARASPTPEGPGALAVTWEGGIATVSSSGPGGAWLDARAEALLGLHDDVAGFAPVDGAIGQLWHRFPGARVGRTGTLWTTSPGGWCSSG